MPGGVGQVIELAEEGSKFSLGTPDLLSFSQPTIWVVLAFGFFDNLRNFGIDQSYVQRYIAASSEKEAAKSVWLGALLYVPVSALFFFIGTALFAFYSVHPEDEQEVRLIVARQQAAQSGNAGTTSEAELEQLAADLEPADLGDRVFPHFIAAKLPIGARGLLIAAIFAAAMSTVSTSLNSSATLVMSDFYVRLAKPNAADGEKVWVLRAATIAWGIFGTLMALALVRLTDSVLDIWWLLSSVLGAAVVGLFLLGLLVPKIRSGKSIVAVVAASLVIAWMVVSQSSYWPDAWQSWKSPFHKFLVIVVGPTVTIAIGWLLATVIAPEQGETSAKSD